MSLWNRVLDATIVCSFDRSGFERHARAFDDRELDVSMAGRACLVTGANRGLGRAAALGLARRGASVHLLCRDRGRGQEARDEIAKRAGNDDVHVHEIDLASIRSIRAFVEGFDAPRVDVLVHNAGVLPHERRTSDDGLELTVAVHVVGPHVLTHGLQPRFGDHTRVVFVTSGGMYAKRLDVDAMLEPSGRYDGVSAYAMTKRAQVVLTEQWADQLRGSGTVVHAMHPGWAETPGVQDSLPRFARWMQGRLRSPEQGADTIVWLAAADEPGRSTGELWFDRARASIHRLPWTHEDASQRDRLWSLATDMVERYEQVDASRA